ncbi:MAG: hypothetical protein H0U65_07725 [Rubrobacter sp.]|nr:hypothetical protein [Rubrobacter sp.]
MLGGFFKALLYSMFTIVFSVAIFVFFTDGGAAPVFGAVVVLILFVAVMLAMFLSDIGKGLEGDGWDGGYGTPGDSGGD